MQNSIFNFHLNKKIISLFLSFVQYPKTMEHFVQSLPSSIRLNSKNMTVIVMGNESCDLDSAVSSIVFAHFLSQQNPSKTVIPLLNVLRDELPLKTEVIHCLQTKLGLQVSDLVCRDDFPLENLENFEMVLVDHHALTGKDVQFTKKAKLLLSMISSLSIR